MKDFHDLKAFAESEGFVVTSTTGGTHNIGSKHYRGLAIDVRTRNKTSGEVDLFIRKCKTLGIVVRDEREKPERQKVWLGQHLHLEIGANTETSVREFQRAHGLRVDGIAGAKTIEFLNELFTLEGEL